MSLNIKNESVHADVRVLAARLGVSQTSAVERAVRAQLAALDAEAVGAGPSRAARVRGAAAAARDAFRGVELPLAAADLYDETTGLPR